MQGKEQGRERDSRHRSQRQVAGALAALLCGAGLVSAADSAQAANGAGPDAVPVKVELNKLEPQSNACRVYFLIENGGPAIKTLKLDLFVLGRDGIVEKRLAVETAPIAASKTIVKLFDLAGVPCERVGKVLLNDVMTCYAATQAPAPSCLDRVEITSRTPEVPFVR